MLYYSFAEIQSLKKQPTEAFYEKKVFLKNSKFSQENTSVRVPFKIKLQASKSKKMILTFPTENQFIIT